MTWAAPVALPDPVTLAVVLPALYGGVTLAGPADVALAAGWGVVPKPL